MTPLTAKIPIASSISRAENRSVTPGPEESNSTRKSLKFVIGVLAGLESEVDDIRSTTLKDLFFLIASIGIIR